VDAVTDAARPARSSFRRALSGLERSLLAGERCAPVSDRRAAAAGEPREGPLHEYLERVRTEAHAVTDAEVAELRRLGHTDDEIFELTVCAAFGAAQRRLGAGQLAIAAAYDEE
jgi:alkylhydroperoxidase family enzyme